MAQTPGIRTRHGRACASRTGARCNCEPTYEAWVYSKRDEKKIRRSFATQAAAKGWRTDALKPVKDKRLRAPTPQTLRQEVDEWLAGRARGPHPEQARAAVQARRAPQLRARASAASAAGARRAAARRHRPRRPARAEGAAARGGLLGVDDPQHVRAAAGHLPARRRNGAVPIEPDARPRLADAGTRNRTATPQQAAELLDPSPSSSGRCGRRRSTPVCGVASFAASACRDVDIDAGTIRVERGWDDGRGPDRAEVAGRDARRCFCSTRCGRYLEPLSSRSTDPDAICLRLSRRRRSSRGTSTRKARRGVEGRERQADEGGERLRRRARRVVGLHEARHSFSTFLDHAGCRETRADRYMGHSAPGVAGRYRHLLPTQMAAMRELVDAYLAGATAGKVVQLARAQTA